ncbi:unnamed protein product [Phytomonas sp. EM1]|nr:unnamed protein product [Phytomonas sp. EM1]|eukprot:CCW65155.1 unnamed protein product [Phytomonas sp. isolate EM1]
MTDYTNGNADLCFKVWPTPQLGAAFTPLKADPLQTFPLIPEQHYWVPVSMPIPTSVMMPRATTVANAGSQVFSQGLCMDPSLLMSIPMGSFSQLRPPQSQLPAYSHTSPQTSQPSRTLGPSDASTESGASLTPPQPHLDVNSGEWDALTICPHSVRKNGLLYATNTQYEGRVKRYSHMRGFGFLTATHRLTPLNGEGVAGLEQCEGGWPGAEDSASTGTSETVVEIDGVRYLRKPVRIGDIFVHYQKIRVPLDTASSAGVVQNFTVGACVYFRADWGTNPGSLQAVDVRLLLRPGRVPLEGCMPPTTGRDSSPIGPPPPPPPPFRPASLTPPRHDSNCSWESSELEFLAKHSLPSGQSNGGTSISKVSTLGESDGVGHPGAGIIGIPDIPLKTQSERIDNDGGSLVVLPDTCNTDLTNLFTTSTNTFLWI